MTQTEKAILAELETHGGLQVHALFEALDEVGVDEEEFSAALGYLIGRGIVQLTGDQTLDLANDRDLDPQESSELLTQ